MNRAFWLRCGVQPRNYQKKALISFTPYRIPKTLKESTKTALSTTTTEKVTATRTVATTGLPRAVSCVVNPPELEDSTAVTNMSGWQQNSSLSSQSEKSINQSTASTSSSNQSTDQSKAQPPGGQSHVNWDKLVDEVFHDEIKDFHVQLNHKARTLQKH